MVQNVQRGMVRDDDSVFRRQIMELLANPRIGPLSAASIAANLGVSPERIVAALESLIRVGQLVRAAPDTYTAPPVVDGEPLVPHPRLAPAVTPPDAPEALRGDWLLVGDTEIAKDAKQRERREGREEKRQRITTEETERTEGETEGEEERGTAEDTEEREVSGAADGRAT